MLRRLAFAIAASVVVVTPLHAATIHKDAAQNTMDLQVGHCFAGGKRAENANLCDEDETLSFMQHSSQAYIAAAHSSSEKSEEQKDKHDDAGGEKIAPPKSLQAAINGLEMCIKPENLKEELDKATDQVLAGLPKWPDDKDTPHTKEDITIAYLTQVSMEYQLQLLKRVYHRIYDPKDVFLYLVDDKKLDPKKVLAALPGPLPSNVYVQSAFHAGYFYWPRVQVVLDGMSWLLQHNWDFVVHLSESDYPVHSRQWLRSTLATQRRTNFIRVQPRCSQLHTNSRIFRSPWYWWKINDAVASCGTLNEPVVNKFVQFPMEKLEKSGFRFASSIEWVVLTREMVKYALAPELVGYRRLIAMHSAADEIFWATLAINIPGLDQTVSPQGWYVHFDPASHGHSPETLSKKHEEILALNRRMYFFIRKVEESKSRHVLQVMDDLSAEPDEPGPPKAKFRWDSFAVACPAEDNKMMLLQEATHTAVDISSDGNVQGELIKK